MIEVIEPIRISKKSTTGDNYGNDLILAKLSVELLEFPFQGINQSTIKIVDTATKKEIQLKDLNEFERSNVINSLTAEYKFLKGNK